MDSKRAYCVCDGQITEISYERETAKSYLGCKVVGTIIGRWFYSSDRNSKEWTFATLGEAAALCAEQLKTKLSYKERDVQRLRKLVAEAELLREPHA